MCRQHTGNGRRDACWNRLTRQLADIADSITTAALTPLGRAQLGEAENAYDHILESVSHQVLAVVRASPPGDGTLEPGPGLLGAGRGAGKNAAFVDVEDVRIVIVGAVARTAVDEQGGAGCGPEVPEPGVLALAGGCPDDHCFGTAAGVLVDAFDEAQMRPRVGRRGVEKSLPGVCRLRFASTAAGPARDDDHDDGGDSRHAAEEATEIDARWRRRGIRHGVISVPHR